MRAFIGIVWFIAIFLSLYTVFSVIVGVVIFNGGHVGNTQEQVASVVSFSREHALILSISRWGILLVSLVAASFGTWKRVLPGTRNRSNSAAETQRD